MDVNPMSNQIEADFLERCDDGGSMSAELRTAIRASVLFPSHHEEKAERLAAANQKLREPRQLYSATSLQHPPKWPIECQVVPEKIVHLNIPPGIPEPLYVTTNTEPQPRPVGEEMGTVIYDYQPKLYVDYVLTYCRSSFSGSEELTAYDFDETTLKFESRFESGNLAKVIKVTNVYYELYLRPDMYTDRHAQWFYFRIRNTRENVVYRFSIVNLSKPDSLYRTGMKPLMYSEKSAQINGIGWTRCGHNISYYKNDTMANDNTFLYTLTFNLKFQYSNDTVFIAQSYPYTYSNLQLYLQEIQCDPFKARLCQQRLLCKSLAGNNVYVLTITAPDSQDQDQVKKSAVVLTARVHPGESPSSFMMKGIIDFLTSESPHAEELRNRFIFKLIPMLNPDGVIVGNSRCCLLGQDLNRQYRTVLREAFPQIYQKKVLLRRLADENGIFLYCDIHGHSRKNNVFMYGCENRRIPEKRLTEQVFPLMMHKNAADKFSFSNCKFRIQRNKEGTGRIFVWTLGVTNSYTLEISLCGSTLGSRENTHFSYVDYDDVGRHFCETLLDYSDTAAAKEKIRSKILDKLSSRGSTAEEPVNIQISDYSSLSHSDTDESDTTEDDEEVDIVKSKHSVARQVSVRNSRGKLTKQNGRPESTLRATKIRSFQQSRRNYSRVSCTQENDFQLSAQSMPKVTLASPLFANTQQPRENIGPSPQILVMAPPAESQEETEDGGTPTEDECDRVDVSQKNEIHLKDTTNPRTTSLRVMRLNTAFESLNFLTNTTRTTPNRRSPSLYTNKPPNITEKKTTNKATSQSFPRLIDVQDRISNLEWYNIANQKERQRSQDIQLTQYVSKKASVKKAKFYSAKLPFPQESYLSLEARRELPDGVTISVSRRHSIVTATAIPYKPKVRQAASLSNGVSTTARRHVTFKESEVIASGHRNPGGANRRRT